MPKGNSSKQKSDLVEKLRRAKLLLDECIAEFAGDSKGSVMRKRRAAPDPSPETLPNHILNLRNQGYFKQPRTATETQQKLSPVYPCEFDRVAMSLLRLQRKKAFRKTSKKVGKRIQTAYVW